jgi:hypothetical protein
MGTRNETVRPLTDKKVLFRSKKGEIMVTLKAKQAGQMQDLETVDMRWKDMYRVGLVSSLAFIAAIALAVIVYFIWPYQPGYASVEDIFALLQSDRVAGLLSLELSVPLLMPIMILLTVALYVALKPASETYALIAMVFGLMGAGLWLTARPLAEIAYLSDLYSAATSAAAKSQYVGAAEGLSAMFNGTAWMMSQFMLGIAGLIESLLMFRIRAFGRTTAYVGLAVCLTAFGIFIPGIGPLLSLAGTIAGIAWYALIARGFYKLDRLAQAG